MESEPTPVGTPLGSARMTKALSPNLACSRYSETIGLSMPENCRWLTQSVAAVVDESSCPSSNAQRTRYRGPHSQLGTSTCNGRRRRPPRRSARAHPSSPRTSRVNPLRPLGGGCVSGIAVLGVGPRDHGHGCAPALRSVGAGPGVALVPPWRTIRRRSPRGPRAADAARGATTCSSGRDRWASPAAASRGGRRTTAGTTAMGDALGQRREQR